MIITRPDVRKWIYGIATAAFTVLGVYGLATGQQIAAWNLLACAITGMATANTPAIGNDQQNGFQ